MRIDFGIVSHLVDVCVCYVIWYKVFNKLKKLFSLTSTLCFPSCFPYICIFNGEYMINWHKLIMIVICWRISTLHAIELKRIHFRAISICWRRCVSCQQADGIDVFVPVRRGYTLKAQRDLTTLSSQMHALRISDKHTKLARARARAGVEEL